MKVRVLKDIVIPAGTILEDSPRKTERHGAGHVETILAVGRNNTAVFTAYVGPKGSAEREDTATKDAFEIVEEADGAKPVAKPEIKPDAPAPVASEAKQAPESEESKA